MKMFKAIDSRVLRIFTTVAHWLQQMIGVMSYTLAKFGTGIKSLNKLKWRTRNEEISVGIATCLRSNDAGDDLVASGR
jgi:hypothetical protein